MIENISSTTPAEQALDSLDAHQDSEQEITEKNIESVYRFVSERLLTQTGRLSDEAAFASDRLEYHIDDFLDELVANCDNMSGLGLLANQIAHGNGDRALIELTKSVNKTIKYISETYYECFRDAAISAGYLEGDGDD